MATLYNVYIGKKNSIFMNQNNINFLANIWGLNSGKSSNNIRPFGELKEYVCGIRRRYTSCILWIGTRVKVSILYIRYLTVLQDTTGYTHIYIYNIVTFSQRFWPDSIQ